MPDYGNGLTNIDFTTGIRYGVISQHEVLQAWSEVSEAYYGKPDKVECPHCGEDNVDASDADWGDSIDCHKCDEVFSVQVHEFADPVSHFLDSTAYKAECGDSGDIFITKSPYYTYAPFCSPCAPGAGYLADADKVDATTGVKSYCFGHDFFNDNKAPYKVFSVATNEEI